jgi:putative heme iron utilization protein
MEGVPELDHGVPAQAPPPVPQPLTDVPAVPRRSAAEEARTLLAATNVATLATLSDDGGPWASMVTYAALDDGSPVLCVSRLAEHGRNLARDPRASLVVVDPAPVADPLAAGRVTLAGVAERPEGEAHAGARAAYLDQVASGAYYIDYTDFTVYVLRVQRVRWVGGYGRMDSADAPAYAAARPDPVGVGARGAVDHLNDDHADALLAMATALGGYPDATAARCTAADRYGLDLVVETPRGAAPARVGFAAPVTEAGGLRAAAVELTRRARAGSSTASSET